jgi:hypothetical protein
MSAFALNDDRPPFAFAGIWTEFKGDRGRGTRATAPAWCSKTFAMRRGVIGMPCVSF